MKLGEVLKEYNLFPKAMNTVPPKTEPEPKPEPEPEPDRKDLPSDTQEDQPVRPEPKTATKPELKPIEGVALPFDPQRDRARGLMAGLCDWVRQYGIGVYEVHYKDKLFIYWVVGEQEVKVYEVEYKQKTLDELEKEVRRILGLVMRADRLMKEGYDRDLLIDLVLRAKETNGRVIFMERNGRLEVYEGKRLVKTLHRG